MQYTVIFTSIRLTVFETFRLGDEQHKTRKSFIWTQCRIILSFSNLIERSSHTVYFQCYKFLLHPLNFLLRDAPNAEIERKRRSNCTIQCFRCILFDSLPAFYIFCTFQDAIFLSICFFFCSHKATGRMDKEYKPKNNGWGFVALLLFSSFFPAHFFAIATFGILRLRGFYAHTIT